MQLRTAGLLFDVRSAAQYIAEDTNGATFETFLANRLLRQAVDRNILIIGEAVNRLQRHDPETAQRISDNPRMVGMRNILVHAYESVDYATVWRTVQESIPVLLTEVEALPREVNEDETGSIQSDPAII